jgi:hypothetical protein
MADKPRVKAPKQRSTSKPETGPGRRALVVIAAGAATVLVAVAGVFFLLGAGGAPSEDEVRGQLEAAGCTLQAVKAQRGSHTLTPDGTANWNTDPPTSGPHFGFNPNGSPGTVIWAAYTEPVQPARIVHNLEHGGVFIFYGDEVTEPTVAQLRAFYDDHKQGTVLAPYPKLGDKIALGAWVADGAKATGYLAKCPTVDEGAFSSFLAGFQFKGPEPYGKGSLLPGGN